MVVSALRDKRGTPPRPCSAKAAPLAASHARSRFVIGAAPGIEVDPAPRQRSGERAQPLALRGSPLGRSSPWRDTSRSSPRTCGPVMPSSAICRLCWKSRSARCIRPKDSVDLPRAEAEVVQPALQLRRHPRPVPLACGSRGGGHRARSRLRIARAPGVGTNDPVGIETPRLLKATHGINRRLSITALWVPVGRESERAEARPDIAHCFAGVTQSIEPHRRIVTGSAGLG